MYDSAFCNLAPLQNDTHVTSQCGQFTFGDKGVVTYQIRECSTCDEKRGEAKEEKQQRCKIDYAAPSVCMS